MSLNSDIDNVIVSLKAYALANTVADVDASGQPVQRPMTELEALGVAAVRLGKRYAAQAGIDERPALAALANRANAKIFKIDAAMTNAEIVVAAANAAAIKAAANIGAIAD